MPQSWLHRSGLVPYEVGPTLGPGGLRGPPVGGLRRRPVQGDDARAFARPWRWRNGSNGPATRRGATTSPGGAWRSSLASLTRIPDRLLRGGPGNQADVLTNARGCPHPALAAERLRRLTQTLRMKIATTVYRRMALLTYPLQEGPIPARTSRLGVCFDELGTGDVDADAYRRLRPDRVSPPVRHRLAQGDRCFVCRLKSDPTRIVDAGWITDRPMVDVPYLHGRLRLCDGDVYYYDTYTDPAFRGRGLFLARVASTGRRLQAEGYARSVALVAVENRGSLDVLQHSGLVNEGVFTCLRLAHGVNTGCGFALHPTRRCLSLSRRRVGSRG